MEKFSKKYNRWFLLEDKFKHPKNNNLFKFGDYWYNYKKDIFIHNDNVEEYLINIDKKTKSIKKDAYCIKNGIEIKE